MRSAQEGRDDKEREVAWATTLDQNTATFLETLANRRVSQDLEQTSSEMKLEQEFRIKEAQLDSMIKEKEYPPSSGKDKSVVYDCAVCNKRFEAKEYIIKHIYIHHMVDSEEEKTLPVSSCGKPK